MDTRPPVMLKIARFAFAAWLIVELLSWLKILPLTLEFTWFGLMLTASFVWLGLEIISWRLRKAGARYLWGLTYLGALLSLCVDAFGDIFRFYGSYTHYDQFAHFIGGAMIALVVFDLMTALYKSGKISIPLKGRGVLAIATAMAMGSLYEIEEYSEDVLFGSHRLGDAFDTANDMLLNTLGAIAIIIIIVMIRRRKKFQ
jgi:uncharacterized membrane protein YjdF